MNRQERRKRSISKTDRTFNVKESELKKIKDQSAIAGDDDDVIASFNFKEETY